jgi:hypothetical protein
MGSNKLISLCFRWVYVRSIHHLPLTLDRLCLNPQLFYSRVAQEFCLSLPGHAKAAAYALSSLGLQRGAPYLIRS